MVTVEQATDNAARMLNQAADETNLAIADVLCRIAEAWTAIAALMVEQAA